MTYYKLPEEVQAVQVTDLHQPLPEWLSDWHKVEVYTDTMLIALDDSFTEYRLSLGDWIVVNQDNEIEFYSNKDFQTTFTSSYDSLLERVKVIFEQKTKRRKPRSIAHDEWKKLKRIFRLLSKI